MPVDPTTFLFNGHRKKRPEYEAEQLFLPSARIKNRWSQAASPPDFLGKEYFKVV